MLTEFKNLSKINPSLLHRILASHSKCVCREDGYEQRDLRLRESSIHTYHEYEQRGLRESSIHTYYNKKRVPRERWCTKIGVQLEKRALSYNNGVSKEASYTDLPCNKLNKRLNGSWKDNLSFFNDPTLFKALRIEGRPSIRAGGIDNKLKVMRLDEKVMGADGKVMGLGENVMRLDEKVMGLDEKVMRLNEKVMRLDGMVMKRDGLVMRADGDKEKEPPDQKPKVEHSTGEDEGDLPEEPTTCCMSGCANCVWIEYAEKLNEIFQGESDKAKRIILNKVKDPNMKAFLQMELDVVKNKDGGGEKDDGEKQGGGKS